MSYLSLNLSSRGILWSLKAPAGLSIELSCLPLAALVIPALLVGPSGEESINYFHLLVVAW